MLRLTDTVISFLLTDLRKEIANHVCEDCITKWESNQGAAQGTRVRKHGGNIKRVSEWRSKKSDQGCLVLSVTSSAKEYYSGHYSCNLTATSGDVTLNVSKLKDISFETAVIEAVPPPGKQCGKGYYEMYLAGVSVRVWRRLQKCCEAAKSLTPLSLS